jgi:hypothetical protein
MRFSFLLFYVSYRELYLQASKCKYVSNKHLEDKYGVSVGTISILILLTSDTIALENFLDIRFFGII